LPDEIAKIIGISPRILCKTGRVDGANIAQGMSWAARREITWSEDKAYCLMGLFRVNMPMLYGREKAFERLQLEIIKKSNDHSIFAWSLTPKGIFSASYLPNTRGLLSYSPAEFGHCEKILASTEMVTEPYSMANLGLFIKLPIVDNIPLYKEASSYTILSCYLRPATKERHFIAIRLEKLDDCRVYI